MSDRATATGTRSVNFELDISDAVRLKPATIAGTVTAPTEVMGPANVICAFPGGGYNRRYFELDHPELSGPTEAQWHAQQGAVFVSFDPYGDGDSAPQAAAQRDLKSTTRAFDRGTRQLLRALATGTLAPELPSLSIRKTIGVGHSLGGMQLVSQQGEHATFDAVAILGWSCVQTIVPGNDGRDGLAPHNDPDDPTLTDAWAGPLVDEIAHLRYAYHWDDVPETLVAEDMSAGFPVRTADPLPAWISRGFPPFAAVCLEEGIVRDAAAAVTTPVFVACGERDVLTDIRYEAAAFSGSTDITLYVIPRCAHLHNFSPQRRLLWERLQAWINGL
jgi:alpha-beta hydrolase superfamily lysophospholipase